MYRFRTIDNPERELSTQFSPLEISNYIIFDALDEEGQNVVIAEDNVNYKSFYYFEG